MRKVIRIPRIREERSRGTFDEAMNDLCKDKRIKLYPGSSCLLILELILQENTDGMGELIIVRLLSDEYIYFLKLSSPYRKLPVLLSLRQLRHLISEL